ncbi:hypothetical protein CHISP_0134 [Chitinispirillum alkaliphilum]|nr:hypothetical protein CHISP_0134 [Chitinispirillum alkaliphilum]
MNKYLLITALLSLIVLPSHSQIIIEDDVVTDTISIFSEPEIEIPSNLLIATSIVLPGLGHHLLERPVQSFVYTTADLVSIFGAIVCYSHSRQISADARAHAWRYAGASGDPDDNLYWRHVGRFMDTQEFNNTHDLNRTPDERYIDTDLYWKWSDESFKDEYNDLRESSRRFQVASSFFMGALVLNRVVSFVDARTSIRRKNVGMLSSLEFIPHYSHFENEYGLSLSARF